MMRTDVHSSVQTYTATEKSEAAQVGVRQATFRSENKGTGQHCLHAPKPCGGADCTRGSRGCVVAVDMAPSRSPHLPDDTKKSTVSCVAAANSSGANLYTSWGPTDGLRRTPSALHRHNSNHSSSDGSGTNHFDTSLHVPIKIFLARPAASSAIGNPCAQPQAFESVVPQ